MVGTQVRRSAIVKRPFSLDRRPTTRRKQQKMLLAAPIRDADDRKSRSLRLAHRRAVPTSSINVARTLPARRPCAGKHPPRRRAPVDGTAASSDTRENLPAREANASRPPRPAPPTPARPALRPDAPTAVSEVMTRSRFIITAAVSRNAPASSSVGPQSKSGKRSASAATCSAPKPFCRLMNRTPATSASGRNSASGIDRRRSLTNSALPCQAMPTLNPSTSASRACQLSTAPIGRQVRHVGRNVVECRLKHGWQLQQRHVHVKWRQRRTAGHRLGVARLVQQRHQRRLHFQHHVTRPLAHGRQVAEKMERVAQPLFGVNQHGAARPAAGRPTRAARTGDADSP